MIERNNRLLIVDDNQSIHEDFRKILTLSAPDPELLAAENLLFETDHQPTCDFVLTVASQGEEALELTRQAMQAGRPFALAFVDIRMPPGLDGIETARQLWTIDPDLQIVICSAYSDYAWSDMNVQLGSPERWVLLKKPFENIEVLQLAVALSEKRALQQVARARQADLEALVAERTEKLSVALRQLEREAAERARGEEERRSLERKLEHAQRLESLGVLAGGVAHDFNNILTGICGHAALAKMAVPPNSDGDKHLREIELCARRAAELCEQMLTYAGQGHVAHRDLDVNQLVREMDGLVHATVPRDVDLQMTLAADLPRVSGDAGRLRQIVMNLLINGAEALRDEPRRLELATRLVRLERAQIAAMTFPGEAQPGGHVCIEVVDTGTGMSAETLQRIFEPFFTTKFAGRGLGLCAVHGIVRSHAGALEVQSTVGRGSTFRVYLPTTAARQAAAAPEAPGRLEAYRGNARVLLVDDEECVRMVAGTLLRRQGYKVTTANDGLDALERLRQAPDEFDGVVIDMTMPRMSGATAIEAMRAIRPQLPTVLMSGYGKQKALEGLSDPSFIVPLQKPFDMHELCRALAEVLEQARTAAGQVLTH